MKRRNGNDFLCGEKKDRNKEIITRFFAGESRKELAIEMDISRVRVGQIINHYKFKQKLKKPPN